MGRCTKPNFKKGFGEFTAFAIIAPILCLLILELCAFIQLTTAAHDIAKAMDAAGRSAAICTNIEDATEQATLVAQNSITNNNVSEIEAEVELINPSDEWKAGTIILVTLRAKVSTVSFRKDPVFSSESRDGYVTKSMIYTIEGSVNSDLRSAIVQYALLYTYTATPYDNFNPSGRLPGEPMDCGQLVCSVFVHFNMDMFAHRTEITTNYGREIEFSEIQPGDVVYYPAPAPGQYAHVAIYIGNGKIVECTEPKARVSNVRNPSRIVNIIDYWGMPR